MDTRKRRERRLVSGIGVSGGCAAGPLFFLNRAEAESIDPEESLPASPAEEWERLAKALETVKEELGLLAERTQASVGEEEAGIFRIHAMLLEDEDLLDAFREEIFREEKNAEEALEAGVDRFSAILGALDDPYLAARTADLADLATQVRRALRGRSSSHGTALPYPCLLVAEDLSPSETILLDRTSLLGLVTLRGTPSSHTAILARAMGIPALVNVGSLDPLYDGETALLDAVAETLLLAPTEEEELAFLERVERERRIAREHEAYLHALGDRPAVTQSGRRILIYANIGDGSEVESALAGGAEGIGLLRSEFLYLGLGELPSEETLFHAYADVVLRMGDKRTVIRTLDAGADKQLPYLGLPQEENPALGMRAIRICLARREMFKTQLRAILRASALGHLAVMLPMIVSPAEVRACRELLDECMRELTAEGKVFDQNLEFGIMIETPAAALQARELAEQVDFFSVGTNDLLQYTLAADRQNPLLAQLCEENREPVLRLIGEAADAIHEKGGWIGVCGEMAADLRLTQRLLALGVDELSVAPPYLLSLRRRVTECE